MLSSRPFECPPVLLEQARRRHSVTTAIANAGSALALESAKQAAEKDLIEPILVGDRNDIARTADEIEWDIRGYEIFHAYDEEEAAVDEDVEGGELHTRSARFIFTSWH